MSARRVVTLPDGPTVPGVTRGAMDTVALGTAGLRGWRAEVGDAVARPVADHSRPSADQVRAAIGAGFFLLSLIYVTGPMRRMLVGRV